MEISTANALEHIASVVQDLKNDTIYTETLWNLWKKTLWTCVLVQFRNHGLPVADDMIIVDNYLKRMKIEASDTVDTTLSKLAGLYRDVIKADAKKGLSEVFRQFNENHFECAKAAATCYKPFINTEWYAKHDLVEEEFSKIWTGLLEEKRKGFPTFVQADRPCLKTQGNYFS